MAAPPAISGMELMIGRDDRTGAGHRLEDRQPEGLIERGIHQEIGRPVEVDSLLVRHPADEDDVVGDAELDNQLWSSAEYSLVTLGSEDDELTACELVTDQPPGAQ